MPNGVLFISPHYSDAKLISQMLAPLSMDVDHATGIGQAKGKLRSRAYSAILTETELPDGSWSDVIELAYEMGLPCPVIVTDRLADDALWAEALNLGAYDLLAQPFDRSEVQRILTMAYHQTAQKLPSREQSAAAAAGAAYKAS